MDLFVKCHLKLHIDITLHCVTLIFVRCHPNAIGDNSSNLSCCQTDSINRLSTSPGNPANLLEHEIAPGHLRNFS